MYGGGKKERSGGTDNKSNGCGLRTDVHIEQIILSLANQRLFAVKGAEVKAEVKAARCVVY